MSDLKISVMITTRNRVEDLKKTCLVLEGLSPVPHEVLVTADGCEDNTVEFIESRYPNFKLTVNQVGRGSVASRASMMQNASGDLVLALDDDSYPEQMDCLKKLSDYFIKSPKLAIATFPQRTDEYPESLTQTDFGIEKTVHSFPNSGACFRLSVYKQLPGFEPLFFHMYEEPDYALQCLANNWEVKYTPIITIRHHYSMVTRNEIRNHHLHSRNEFWSIIMRCPFPYLFGVAGYRVLSQLGYAIKRGPKWVIREPIWWWKGIKGLFPIIKKRKPLTWKGYKVWLASAKSI